MQTAARRSFDYDMPLIQTPTSACQIRQAWAKVADTPDRETAGRLKDEIKALLKEKNAVLVAHYYVDPLIQDLALETGGCVGDSLEMARFGAEHEADTLVVAGVRFMGESAKILCPEKTVLMPDLEAECSLDLGCPEEAFSAFCNQHPDRTVVVYANTSAAVKARADWVVTSSVALEIVSYLKSRGEKLIWGPDRHLGDYIRRETGADMLLWQGSCIVHNEFKGQELAAVEGGTSRRGGAGSIPNRRKASIELGERGRLDQQTAQSRRIASRKKNSSWRPTWASCTKCKSRRPTKNSSPPQRRATVEAAKAARSARGWR